MTRKVWIGIAIVAVVAIGLYAIGREEDPAWAVEGIALTADNCVVGCPCIFGEPPTHGHCEYVGIFRVDAGHYGEVDLAGSHFALAGRFVREDRESGPTYTYTAYYIDSGAGDEQRAALRSILTGPAFAALGEPAEVAEVPVSLSCVERFGQVGATYGGSVGEVASVQVTPISGATEGEPLVVDNSAEPLFVWTALGEASDSFYRAGGQEFTFEGTSGESHRFRFAGGGGGE